MGYRDMATPKKDGQMPWAVKAFFLFVAILVIGMFVISAFHKITMPSRNTNPVLKEQSTVSFCSASLAQKFPFAVGVFSPYSSGKALQSPFDTAYNWVNINFSAHNDYPVYRNEDGDFYLNNRIRISEPGKDGWASEQAGSFCWVNPPKD